MIRLNNYSTSQIKIAEILSGTHASQSSREVSPSRFNRDSVLDYYAEKIKEKRESVMRHKSEEIGKIILKKDKNYEFMQ